ncbi:Vacuolar protein sorting-associated protein 41, partial [Neurospora sp. IMI 360204]
TYLSGGLAGQLILTVGAPQGKSTATTTGAAAQAAGWPGNMVGAGSGKDTVLHYGKGTINTIKWSLSGKYVVWLNEHGIKIMRTKLHLESADQEDAWKRIGHIDRPQTEEWDTMASVWKGRAEWIDELSIEPDEPGKGQKEVPASPAAAILKQQHQKTEKKIERLVVGWGGNIWFIHVHPGGMGVRKHAGKRSAGRAEIVKLLRMDCIISGISIYTQNLLLVLAYCLPDEDEDEASDNVVPGHKHTASIASGGSQPSGGLKRRQNNPPPELRLIDLNSQAQVDEDGLSVSRFERLTFSDYHLGVLPARNVAASAANKGTLETLAGFGTDMLNVGLNVGLTGLNATLNPKSLFSSGASIKSRESDEAPSSVTRAVIRAWNSGSIQLINYFGLEGLDDPLNLQGKAGLQGPLMPKGKRLAEARLALYGEVGLMSSIEALLNFKPRSVGNVRVTSSYMGGINSALKGGPRTAIHPNLNKPGIKIFIHSPYDCILWE